MQLFYMPTKVLAGRDCLAGHAELLVPLGKKALIVTGAQSAKRNGAMRDLTHVFANLGKEYALFDRVKPNPDIDCIYAGRELARKEQADFIVAIGGGSPMDAAKGIALLARNDLSPEQLFQPHDGLSALPVVCIPTTAGTGSEVTPYAVLTNHTAQTKMSLAAPCLFPTLSFLDGQYMQALSQASTVHTALDAMSHAIEGMLSVRANHTTDLLAKASLKGLFSRIHALTNGTYSLDDRDTLLYASTLAGMVIANTKTTAVHVLGYCLTYFKGIDHGRANGLLMASYLEFAESSGERERVQEVLHACGLSSIAALKEAYDRLLGPRESATHTEIQKFVEIAGQSASLQNGCAVPDRAAITSMYEKSLTIL